MSNVQQLSTIDHVVISSSDNRNVIGVDLVTQGFLIFPHGCGDSWSGANWLDLANSTSGDVSHLGRGGLCTSSGTIDGTGSWDTSNNVLTVDSRVVSLNIVHSGVVGVIWVGRRTNLLR